MSPAERHPQILEVAVMLNYTTILNVVFLVIAAFLVIRFYKTGGPEMIRMM